MNRAKGTIFKSAFSKSHGRTKKKLNFMLRSCYGNVTRFLQYNFLRLSINIIVPIKIVKGMIVVF